MGNRLALCLVCAKTIGPGMMPVIATGTIVKLVAHNLVGGMLGVLLCAG